MSWQYKERPMKNRLHLIALLLASGVLTGNAMIAFPSDDDSLTIHTKELGDTLELTYSIPSATISESDGFASVTIAQTEQLTGTGKPLLPFLPLRLAVPEGKRVGSIELTISAADTLNLSSVITPGSEYVVPGAPHSLEYSFDPAIYGQDSYWPTSDSRFNGLVHKKGNPIASIQLFPVRYNDKQKQIIAAREISLRVIWEQEIRSRTAPDLKRRQLNTEVLNIQNTPVPVGSLNSRSGGAVYLAITSQALKESNNENNLQALLSHHESNGLTTKILTVEEIENSYEGVDRQEKIRNAIKDHYNNDGTEYVLLAGDSDIIPPRYFFMDDAPYSDLKASNRRIPIITDVYYSCLDGNHNYDNDTLWGETNDGVDGGFPDLLSEVYVGRISLENDTELNNFVSKTLSYLNGNVGRKILLAGEHLGFGGISEYAEPSMEEVWAGGEANGYFTRSFASNSSLEKDTLYAEGYPKSTWTGHPQWNPADLLKRLDTDQFAVVNHLGHGQVYTNMRISYGTSAANDSIAFNNNTPIFVNSQACLSGKFDEESIAEHMTSGNPKGMWAGIWNSHWGLGAVRSTDSPSQFFQRQFWHAFFGKEIDQVGKMNAFADEMAIERQFSDWSYRWVAYVTHLHGDPAAPMILNNGEPVVTIDPIGDNVVWEQGHTFDITWYDNFKTPITIELIQNGEVVNVIAESTESDQHFEWNIGNDVPLGKNFQIRITGIENGAFDISEPLSIDPTSTLTLIAPAGGESYLKGETVHISWEDNLSESVSLLLYYGEDLHDTIALGIPTEQQSYDWEIPMTLHHSDGYFIRVVSETKEWLHAVHDTAIELTAAVINEYPYELTFDDQEQGKVIYDWAQPKNGKEDDFDWRVHSGATPSRQNPDDWWNQTGPSQDVSGNGSYIYIEGTGHADGKAAGLLSPKFDITNLQNGELTVKVHMYCKEDYGNMGKLNIYLLIDGEWKHAIHMDGNNGDTWIDKRVDLTPYANAKEMYIYILANTGKSFASDIAIDEIRVTGEKAAVSVVNSGTKAMVPGCEVYPAILADTDRSVIVQLNRKNLHDNVVYKIFDVVGNKVVESTAIPQRENFLWKLPVPASLGRGMYLLHVESSGDEQFFYRATIGKK